MNVIVEPLSRLLAWLNAAFAQLPLPAAISSYALALIAIAVIVKVVTYPLTRSQMRSMRAMQEVQPQLRELQRLHKGDRDALAKKQMELYRERGVNPFGGCLPLLIQMPVLFGLFRATNLLSSEISGERFLWINDLSTPEPLPTGDPAGIPLLLILLVASQFAYQKFLTPPTTGGDAQSEMMASMTKFMPLMFAFFFFSLPAGVLLYYTAFNVASLVQQVSLNRSLASQAAALPVVATVAVGAGSEEPGKPEKVENDATNKRKRRSKKR